MKLNWWIVRRAVTGVLASIACLFAQATQAEGPMLTQVPGKPVLMLGAFDLAPLGYQTEEYSSQARQHPTSCPAERR